MSQRIRSYLFLAAPLLLFAASPVAANDIADCNQALDAELRVRGCTGFIQSGVTGKNLAIALTNRGVAHNALNDDDSAIADFSSAIEAKPDYSAAFYNRGISHAELGDLELALADFDAAIRLDPNDPEAYDSRGFTYTDLREFERAVTDFDKAIELAPDFGAAYYHRSIAYHALAEIEQALADYDKALELGCLRQGWCPPR